ncbi:TRAP transporter substrate-binding protein DctP [Aminobacter ciceronei]|uniref:Esterase/lipase superfamily enzyme n=1 Tax=Aminobacter ciceronei TaxID=150723 RepID=A0ABR6C6Z8_9HYPH|nr:TRAP transporter substrate-binding protein DctP [Aminobacter ciceronei]MBA8906461.1 esterase/lipase superfamily enzyme [Aminobacter ciceronei]MBA9020413.1 esterase/lipase superfamily enzyme [Aminobacter ciceronei]
MSLRFTSIDVQERLLSDAIRTFNDTINGEGKGIFQIVKTPSDTVAKVSSALADGQADVGIIPAVQKSFPVGSYIPGAGVDGSRKRQQSSIGALELAKLERENLVGLAFWNGPSNFVASTTRLTTVDQLQGLRILAAASGQTAILQAYGSRPTTMAFGEVYTALETASIDAAALPSELLVTSGISLLTQTVVPGAGSSTEFYLVVRQAFWTELSPRARFVLAKAAREAGAVSDRIASNRDDQSLRAFERQGANVLQIGDAQREEVLKLTADTWASREGRPDADILTLAYQASFAPLPPVVPRSTSPAATRKIFFATNRAYDSTEDIEFRFSTAKASNGLVLGTTAVSFDGGRSLDDPVEDVSDIESLTISASADEFSKELADASVKSSQGVLVFVHGYSNRFEDAVRRAAHIAIETNFQGPVVAFSWPSEGETLLYSHDEDRIQATQPDFRTLMNLVESKIGRTDIHLLSHSMGARVLLGYVDTLSAQPRDGRTYRSITIAAGDTPNEVLAQQLHFLRILSPTVSVYFSEKDRALWLSNQLHAMTRVGNNLADQLFVGNETKSFGDAGFDFIDARPIDDAIFAFSPRHAYLFDKKAAIDDYAQILTAGRSATQRNQTTPEALIPKENTGKRYWQLSP